jgi:hypothetical protein
MSTSEAIEVIRKQKRVGVPSSSLSASVRPITSVVCEGTNHNNNNNNNHNNNNNNNSNNNNSKKSTNVPLHFSDDDEEDEEKEDEDEQQQQDDDDDRMDNSCNSSLHDSSVHDYSATRSVSSILDHDGNRWVSRFVQWLLWVLLALVTLLAPWGVYRFTLDTQRYQFESDFGTTAETIAHACDWNVVRKLLALEDLAMEWTTFVAASSSSSSSSSASSSSSWPYVTLPDFDSRATRALTMAGTTSVLFAPHVTRTTRLAWEAYSMEQHSSWMMTTPLMMKKNTTTNSTVLINITGEIYGPHRQAATDSGPFYPVWQHVPLRSDLVNMDLLSLPVIQDDLSAMFHSQQAIIGTISKTAVMDMRLTVSDNDADNDNEDHQLDGETLISNLFVPVFDTLLEGGDQQDRTVVGTLVTSISWNQFFSNLLPASTTTSSRTGSTTTNNNNKPGLVDVVCVLENNCGVAHTYLLRVGQSPEYLGEGDLHTKKAGHQQLEEYYHFPSLGDSSSSSLSLLLQTTATLLPLSDDEEESCTYSIRILPSNQAMAEGRYTSIVRPMIYASSVACFFATLFRLTVAFTRLLNRRMVLVRTKAEESRAVVTNLFPSNVRARLFRRNWEQREKLRIRPSSGGGGEGGGTGTTTGGFRRPRLPRRRILRFPLYQQRQQKSLKTILRDEQSLSGRRQRTILDNDDFLFDDDLENPNAKPIADSFPGTTILFADIAGFTKWSSEREPEKVFILLQTLFGAFDKIARKRGVFKVRYRDGIYQSKYLRASRPQSTMCFFQEVAYT